MNRLPTVEVDQPGIRILVGVVVDPILALRVLESARVVLAAGIVEVHHPVVIIVDAVVAGGRAQIHVRHTLVRPGLEVVVAGADDHVVVAVPVHVPGPGNALAQAGLLLIRLELDIGVAEGLIYISTDFVLRFADDI